MDQDVVLQLTDIKRALEKQNELQEAANTIMKGIIDALKNIGQEIEDLAEDLPAVRDARKEKDEAAKKAAVGILATPPAPRRPAVAAARKPSKG